MRLPPNASIEMSGTEGRLKRRLAACEKTAAKRIERHAGKDAQGARGAGAGKRFEKRQGQLSRRIEKAGDFLAETEKKEGRGGKETRSNVTGNESAMIRSSKGFIQGCIGIAASDRKSRAVTGAQAFGGANETAHLPEMLEKNAENLEGAGVKAEEGKKAAALGDPDYYSGGNFRARGERGIDAAMPDSQAERRLGPDGKNRYKVFMEPEGAKQAEPGKDAGDSKKQRARQFMPGNAEEVGNS